MDNPETKEQNIGMVRLNPSRLLSGDIPRLGVRKQYGRVGECYKKVFGFVSAHIKIWFCEIY